MTEGKMGSGRVKEQAYWGEIYGKKGKGQGKSIPRSEGQEREVS